MADQLPLNGFYQDESRKQSARTCTNFMPVPGDPGDLSQYSLYSTTGIKQPDDPIQSGDPGAMVDRPDIFDGGVITGRSGFFFNSAYAEIRSTKYDLSGSNGFIAGTGEFYPLAVTELARSSFEGSTGKLVYITSFNIRTTVSGVPEPITLKRRVSYIGGWTIEEVNEELKKNDVTNPGLYTLSMSVFDPDDTSEQSNIIDTAYLANRYLYLNARQPEFPEYPLSTVNNSRSNRIYYSEIEDPEEIGALSFFTTTSQIGDLTGMESLDGRLYVFTDSQMAVFAPNNDPLIPFFEQTSSSLNIGLPSPDAKTVVGNSIFLIGVLDEQKRLMTISGGSPKVISNRYIDYLLQDADISESNVFSFTDQGRLLVSFSFADYTFVYDTQTGEFHRRTTNGGRWEVINQAAGVVFSNGDQLGLADPTIGTEYGEIVKRECITSHFNSNGMTNRLGEVAIQADIDYTNYTDQYSNPNMGLSVSSDFGASYGQESFQQFGPLGVFDRLMRWLGLGVFRQSFTIKLRTSNPYPHRVIKMLARLKKGRRRI